MLTKLKLLFAAYISSIVVISCCCDDIPTVFYDIETFDYYGDNIIDSTHHFNFGVAQIDTIEIAENSSTLKKLMPLNSANAMMSKCPLANYICKTKFSNVSITSNANLKQGYEQGKELSSLFTFNVNYDLKDLSADELRFAFFDQL